MACCVGDGFDLFFFSLKYSSLQINRLITHLLCTLGMEKVSSTSSIKLHLKRKLKGCVGGGGDSLLCEIFHWVLSKAIQHMGNTLRHHWRARG